MGLSKEELEAKVKASQAKGALKKEVRPVVKVERVYTKVNGPFDNLEGTGESLFEIIPPVAVEDAVARHNHDQNVNGLENADSQMSVKIVPADEVEKMVEDMKAGKPVGVNSVPAKKETVQELLSKILIKWRKDNNLTQAEASAEIGITETHYHNIEHGKEKLFTNAFKKICDALDLKITITK